MLHESEDRYRDLVEHSEDLLCIHDLEGRLVSVNSAPARILGYSVEELLKIPMRELIIPEARQAFEDYLDRLRTTGAPERGLLCVTTRSGEVRTWEYSNTLRTDGVQKPIVRGMAHDVTERRRAELALRESEERYRTLFEKTVTGVAMISMEGEIIECNDAWAHMFGYMTAAECREIRTQKHYVDPADRVAVLDELRRTGSMTNKELRLVRADGSPLWLLANDVLLQGPGNSQIV